MKRSKRLGILLCVLLLVCGATFAALRYEERREAIQNTAAVLLEVSADSVTSLSWEYEGETLSFHRDGKWLYDSDEAFPVDEETIASFLARFESFGASFVIEDVEDYGQYGLNKPICTIRFSTEDQSYEVLLGDYSKMDSQRYISIGDGNVYLVKDDPLDDFDAALNDMIDNDETPSYDKVTALRFSGGENYEITYQEDSAATYCADDVYFTERNGKALPLDTSRVNSYLSKIKNLSLTDYVTYNAAEEELKAYGLDDPELTVAMDYTHEDHNGKEASATFTLHVSRDPETRKASGDSDEQDEGREITAYARVGDSRIVYRISSDSYQSLMAASYDDLRHPEVLSADFEDVTQLDITLEGERYTLTSSKEKDGRSWSYGGEELEIGDLQEALEALRADSFTTEKPAQKEEISLTVYLDNENFPQVKIDLYRYDGSYCLAVVDGESVSLVERSQVVDLIEAVYAIVLY